jgi:excisionase family DNA binding protein
MSERLALSIPEAAKRLGISRSLAYVAAHKGEIPTFRIGNRMLVPVEALNRIISGTIGNNLR